MKNTTYFFKFLEFDAVIYIPTFTKPSTVAYISKKSLYV